MCILILESKYLNKTETHIQRIIHTNSYKLPSHGCQRKEGGGEGQNMSGIKRYKLLAINSCYKDVMHNTGNVSIFYSNFLWDIVYKVIKLVCEYLKHM